MGKHSSTCTFMWALGRDEELKPSHRAHRCKLTVIDGKHRGNHKCACGRQHGN